MVAAGSINVAVRVRPPTAWEAARLPEPITDTPIRGEAALSVPAVKSITSQTNLRHIVQIIDDRVLTFDPEERDASRAFVERGFLPPGTKRYKDRRFIFDRVFRHDVRQEDVYGGTVRPLLENVLNGYNATVFAYGATGCGKTHTISGTEDDPGIIYLTMADLFRLIDDRREDHIVDVQVSFLEIYNEEIRDLLVEPGVPTRGGLQIREDSNKSVKVVGLTELRPTSADEVKEIVLLGNSRRTQSPTHANATSSRSHAVLQVQVAQAPRTAALSEERTVATLSIIDLAGSERAAATSNMGQRMVEGANINKSLLALGNCINALCESGGATRHIPYRNSKLTRLLKFSLGGNCKTVMIVCVAPTSAHFDDTHNTLIYAERATKIKTKVVTRNVVNVDRHVGQYVEAINRLNHQVEDLKAKLAGKRDAEAEKEKRRKQEAIVEVERAKADMQAKTDQTQPSLVDGATCSGKLSVAEAKLRVIKARLADLDSQAASGALPADLEAERGLLRALAAPEEQALKPNSDLNARVQRSGNSGAMFEATLRAVSERKSDKVDDVSVDNIKLDARWRKAEMERVKAEARREALREAVEAQAQTVVHLVGLLGRCTVMLNEASRTLLSSGEGEGDLEGTAKTVAASLKNVADGNDKAFKSIVGHSTAEYLVGPPTASALDNFKGYPSVLPPTTSGISRVVSGPARPSDIGSRVSRRTSSYGAHVGTSPRKASLGHRSPRKSLRSSMAGSAPYRRASETMAKPKKKGVQWRDEVGQGDLDDRGLGSSVPAAVTVITPASPAFSDEPSLFNDSSSASTSGDPSNSRNTPSRTGSESDWEDEKTEDSFSLPPVPGPSRAPTVTLNENRVGSARRPRASHLTAGFLKSKTRFSPLGSLAETDEERLSPRKPSPLGDRNMNRSVSPAPSSSGSSTSTVGKGKAVASPVKRGTLTPKIVNGNKSGRRRSAIGPVRVERPRRRSSMIPQLSPKFKASSDSFSAGPSEPSYGKSISAPVRRIGSEKSPARRPKRSSIFGTSALSRPALRLTPKTSDANLSADSSFRAGGSKPTWR
ncbi:kinesin-domain-containing protein [Phanerochaete sordida]|uniref:Kinesin-domain-containing protein n=1 Tax=Phanerochaete sordida TaxID=48140 RepID=A0A9P3L710_9APHY|nr:kinesin-domain-containing protein [Phanerochaete sordida]